MSHSNTPSRNNLFLLFVFLILAISGPELATDMYIPSLPAIAHHFSVLTSSAAMTMTGFLLGQTVFQLFYGGYSDLHGRKLTLIIGTSIVLVGSLVCMLATSFTMLMIGRIIQGAGAGAGVSMTLAIARDVYEGPKLAKALSTVFTFYFAVFAGAPIIGGYIQHYISWRANFVILSLYFMIQLLWILFIFKETHTKTVEHDVQNNKILTTLKNYGVILTNRIFLGNVLAASLAYSAMFAYAAITPFLFQKELHLTPVEYGWLSVFMAVSFIISSKITAKLVEKYGIHKPNIAAVSLLFLSGLIMLCLGYLGFTNVWVIMIPFGFFILGLGICAIICSTNAISPFGELAGSASALWGAVQFLLLFLTSMIYAHVNENNQIDFAIILIVLSILVMLSLWLAKSKNK